MKIWVDDCRPAPEGWVWYKTTNEALANIVQAYKRHQYNPFGDEEIEIISLDHDAGPDSFGGDFINILKEFERLEKYDSFPPMPFRVNFPIHLHSMNPVGVQNMRAIIQKNGWKEVE